MQQLIRREVTKNILQGLWQCHPTLACVRSLASGRDRPDEYQGYYNTSESISTRVPSEQGPSRASAGQPEPSDPAEPASSAGKEDMRRAGAEAASAWMFPWERRQMNEGSPLRTWERVYWGGFVTAIAVFLFSRLGNRSAKPEDTQAAAELEEKRMGAARMVLAGKSFTEGLDAFEGLSPAQIQEYVDKAAQGATAKDPFEGMSPAEINDYLDRHQGQAG